MSITVRLWSDEDLRALKQDKWLATIFMNCKTFSEEELRYYPYSVRRTYACEWGDDQITIYATDERTLLRFVDLEYKRRPDFIHQKITQYRPIKFYR